MKYFVLKKSKQFLIIFITCYINCCQYFIIILLIIGIKILEIQILSLILLIKAEYKCKRYDMDIHKNFAPKFYPHAQELSTTHSSTHIPNMYIHTLTP